MPTFIVESYGVDSVVADQRERAEVTAELGEGISYIRTMIIPVDQTLLHLFEAPSSDALGEAVAVAALDCERIVEVVERGGRSVPKPQLSANLRIAHLDLAGPDRKPRR